MGFAHPNNGLGGSLHKAMRMVRITVQENKDKKPEIEDHGDHFTNVVKSS